MTSKIKKGFANIRTYLNDPDVDVRDRLFVVLAIVALSGLLMVSVFGFIFGENLEAVVVCAYGFVLFSVIAYLGFRLRKVYTIAVTVGFLLVFLFLPATFFTSGGIYGGTSAWFIFATLYIGIILYGKIRVILFFSEICVASICWYIQFSDPTSVVEHTREAAFGDSFGSVFVVSIVMSILIGFQAGLYKKENERVQKQKHEIEELNAAQSRFFSSMSHEIRTPINTIIGLNEMILRENSSAEINEDAENIKAASHMLLHLVNDILDVSKLESGKMELNLHPYATGNMLSGIVGMFWLGAHEKGLDFRIEIAPDMPAQLEGDEFRIEQVLVNIINNAIKYTSSGSITLAVQVDKQEDGIAKVIYTVADTGMGIRKENIPFLFDAFKRVEGEKNRYIEGTGLGLSIVKQFVDLMGGTISVNSIYTKGSTFVVEIPQRVVDDSAMDDLVIEKRRDPARRSTYKQSFEAPDAKVLVVDDTEANLMVVEKLLRETGVQITLARSGEEALKETLNNAFDVIFMDHLMPEMDGIECMHKIRSQAGGLSREARIDALTANAGSESAALYEREGFDGYLAKPIDGSILENELIRLLPSDLVTLTGSDEQIIEESKSWSRGSRKKAGLAVTTESVADMPAEFRKRYGIETINYHVETETGIFRDAVDLQTAGILAYMEAGHRASSMPPSIAEYERFFADRLESANNVIHIALSSKVERSGYKAAMEAAESFENVYVVDSRHMSGSMTMMAVEVGRMIEQGKEVGFILDRLDKVADKLRSSFVSRNVDYLMEQYQVGTLRAQMVKAFMVRPIVRLSDGRLQLWAIRFGTMRHAVKSYISEVLFAPSSIDKRLLMVVYAGLEKDELEWIREQIEKHITFEKTVFICTCPAIAVNCGPGTFGLFFRRE